MKKDNSGMIQIETLADCTIKLRGVWQKWNYINLDNTVAGSYIYSDKTTGAIWQLEEVTSGTGVSTVNNAAGVSIFPTFTTGKVRILTNDKSTINILNFSGRIVDSYTSAGDLTVNMNYPDGIYLFQINSGFMSTHKVLLCK